MSSRQWLFIFLFLNGVAAGLAYNYDRVLYFLSAPIPVFTQVVDYVFTGTHVRLDLAEAFPGIFPIPFVCKDQEKIYLPGEILKTHKDTALECSSGIEIFLQGGAELALQQGLIAPMALGRLTGASTIKIPPQSSIELLEVNERILITTGDASGANYFYVGERGRLLAQISGESIISIDKKNARTSSFGDLIMKVLGGRLTMTDGVDKYYLWKNDSPVRFDLDSWRLVEERRDIYKEFDLSKLQVSSEIDINIFPDSGRMQKFTDATGFTSMIFHWGGYILPKIVQQAKCEFFLYNDANQEKPVVSAPLSYPVAGTGFADIKLQQIPAGSYSSYIKCAAGSVVAFSQRIRTQIINSNEFFKAQPPVELVKPTDGEQLAKAPIELQWNLIPDVVSYEVAVGATQDMVRAQKIIIDGNNRLDVSLKKGTYYWQVTALLGAKKEIRSKPSKVSKFTY